MAEPFPDIPSWLVWAIIVFVTLVGTLCVVTLIAGIYTGKWWLVILGLIFSVIWYFKGFLRIFPDMRKLFK